VRGGVGKRGGGGGLQVTGKKTPLLPSEEKGGHVRRGKYSVWGGREEATLEGALVAERIHREVLWRR